MKQTRGLGLVYQPVYIDKRTGERKTAATWWIQYSVRGKRHRESSGSSNRADAVKLLKRRIGEAGQGRLVGPQAEKTTFAQLAQMLIDDYRVNGRRSLKRIKAAIGHLREFFGDELALDITGDRIASYVPTGKTRRQPRRRLTASSPRSSALSGWGRRWVRWFSGRKFRCFRKTTGAKVSLKQKSIGPSWSTCRKSSIP